MRFILSVIILFLLPTGVFGADFTVSTDRTEYTPSEDITVNWTIPESTDTNQNWVAVYDVSAKNQVYRDWAYIGTGTAGTVTLNEQNPGTYEVRLLTNNSYGSVATSNTFTVDTESTESDEPESPIDTDDTADLTYELDVSASTVQPNESVTIQWSTNASSVNQDWIGLHRAGSSNTSYMNWFYVGEKSGSRSFTLRNSGQYEFRYYLNGGYDRVSVSPVVTVQTGGQDTDDSDSDENTENPDPDINDYELTVERDTVTVGTPVSVAFTADQNDNLTNDWVGLYRVGASDRSYVDWKYTNSTNGTLTFTIQNADTYEFRYFKNNGYTRQATSETFTATTPDHTDPDDPDEPNNPNPPTTAYELTSNQANYEPGNIADAIWSAPTGANIVFDWIGLYRAGTSDGSYVDYEYVDILSNREQFPLTQLGTFEFRYFKNNSYRRVAVSEPFTVTHTDTGNQCNGYNLDEVTNFPSSNGPIIALGDSITFGVGASPDQDYVEELERRLNVNIINAGVPADTTADVLARLETDVLDREPSTVIVFIGGNDELRRIYESLNDSAIERELADELDTFVTERLGLNWRNVPLLTRAETFANLESIVTQIQATGANTIIVGFDNTLYNDMIEANYQQIADETGSIYIPNIYNDIFGRPSRMSDLIHPNDVGYDIIADRIQRGLECLVD